MKHKHFYAHLIQINDITLDLGDLDMEPKERVHLLAILEANIHTVVMNTVLNELTQREKKRFLENLLLNDHEKIWNHLKLNSNSLEEKIKKSVDKLLKEMAKDIKSVKSQNKK